jgi:hypothetical protein
MADDGREQGNLNIICTSKLVENLVDSFQDEAGKLRSELYLYKFFAWVRMFHSILDIPTLN